MILVMYVKFSCDRWTNLSGAVAVCSESIKILRSFNKV